MLLSRRSYLPDNRDILQGTSARNQNCSNFSNKPLMQMQFICGDCFEYEHGICQFCYENCHKKLNHHFARHFKPKANFVCECSQALHQAAPATRLDACIYARIAPFFKAKSIYCTICDITLCPFCVDHCGHNSQHFQDQPSAPSNSRCQCPKPHLPKHYKRFILNNIKAYGPPQQATKAQLINQLLENQDLFDCFFKEIRDIFTHAWEQLEYGSGSQKYIWASKPIAEPEPAQEGTLSDRLFNALSDKSFPYKKLSTQLSFIIKLLEKTKFKINSSLADCIPQEQIQYYIGNYHIISQILNESSKEHFDKLIGQLLDIQYLIFKNDCRDYKRISCADNENSCPLTRDFVRIYNQKIDQAYPYIQETIKKIMKFLFEIEFSNPLLYKFIFFVLKSIKRSMQCALIDSIKFVTKILLNVQKLSNDIEYYNQQKFKGKIQPLLHDQIFNLLAEIIWLSELKLKDTALLEHIRQKLSKQCSTRKSLSAIMLERFYRHRSKENFLLQLFYAPRSEYQLKLQKLLLSLVIEPLMEGSYFQRRMKPQKKINSIILQFIREQIYIQQSYSQQLYQIKIEDWLLWKTLITSDECKEESISRFKAQFSRFLQTSTNCGFSSLRAEEFICQFSAFLKSIEGIFVQMEDAVLKAIGNNKLATLPNTTWQLKVLQGQLFSQGLDKQTLMLIALLSQEHENQLHPRHVKQLLKLSFTLLHYQALYNSLMLNKIHQFETLKALRAIGNQHTNQVINFHHRAIVASGQSQIYLHLFNSPSFVLQHLYQLNLRLDSSYSDVSELSILRALEIAENKRKLFQMIQVLVENIVLQQEEYIDFQANTDINQFVYDTILVELIDHSTEFFLEGNTYSNESSYENILEDRKRSNRYARMSLHGALDQLQVFEAELQQHSSFPSGQPTPLTQKQQTSPPSTPSNGSVHSVLSVGTQYTLEELRQHLIKDQYILSQHSSLAISTILLCNLYMNLITLIIYFQSKIQLLHTVELSEQATLLEKIEQIYMRINTAFKHSMLYPGPLSQIPELQASMEQLINLVNYTKDHKSEKSEPQCNNNRNLNVSYEISQQVQRTLESGDAFSVRVFSKFMKKLLELRKQQELPQEVMSQNAILVLMKKEFRSRSKVKIGSIFLNILIQLLQNQTQFQERNIEFVNNLFQNQINYLILFLRLITVETKPIQMIIQSNIEENPHFKEQFNEFIKHMSQKLMPQLVSNVVYFQDQPFLQLITESGRQSIILLEFIRYLAEGQNSYLQNYVGQSGALEQVLTLLIDLLKSKQISDILRENKQTQPGNKRAITNFQKLAHALHPKIVKKGSATEYLRQFLLRKKSGPVNEFLTFEVSTQNGSTYSQHISETFMRVFAHTIITIAEYNQGQQLQNQQLTFDYLSKYRVWQTIIQILTIKLNGHQQESIYTLRLYIFQLILSLLEDPEKSPNDFQYIMNLINHKLLEETLAQTYKALIQFNKLGSTISQLDLDMIASRLTELYQTSQGDNINESLIFDSKMFIKLLYQIYKMLNLYATISKEINQYLTDQKILYIERKTSKQQMQIRSLTESAFQFIFNIVGCIEYLDDKNTLETFHFLKPPMCFFLSSESKFQFLTETIDRSNSSSKLASIIDVIPSFMTEMEENMSKYRKSPFQRKLIDMAISSNFHHRQFSILLTIINFIVLYVISNNNYSLIKNSNDETTIDYLETNQIAVKFSQIILIFTSLLALVCQLFFRMSIYFKLYCQSLDQNLQSLVLTIYRIIIRRDIFQFVLHLLFSILGTFFEPFFFYLQSFLFIYISKTMFSVLEALRLRWIQFLGIFTMLLIILNAYSYIGFKLFTTSFQEDVTIHQEHDIHEQEYLCDTPAHCFLSLVYFGLRDDSGIGTHGDVESFYKSSDYYPRFMFDLSFFIIVTLIMLNIINGIIIDTFADLRDQQQRNEHDTNNVCVICSLERWNFEKKGLQFAQHVSEVHNLWDYVAFIVHLNKVGKENMNGIETYIHTKVTNRDMSWAPQEQTKLLI